MTFSMVYLSIRFLAWVGAATFQGIRVGTFASSQSSMPSITYMIAISTALFALRDLLLLIWQGSDRGNVPLLMVLNLADGLVDSSFMAILLFIASGYCITTHILREIPRYNFILPAIFFVASVTFSWLTVLLDMSHTYASWELQVALAAGLIQAVIAVMSWMAVIENSERVAKQLDQIAPRTQQEEVEAAGTFSISDAVEDTTQGFQAVTEQVTTVAEEVERAEQAKLMRRFKIAVTVYMIAFVVAFFVPAYGKDTDEAAAVLQLWNALLLLFMISLAWVFRPREEHNPYLFIGEDEAQNVHLDTRIELQGMPVIPEEDGQSSLQESGQDEVSGGQEVGSPPRQPGLPATTNDKLESEAAVKSKTGKHEHDSAETNLAPSADEKLD